MRRFKPKTLFSQILMLIIFAVLFSGLFNNLDWLVNSIKFILDVFQPVVIGSILAFFLNVPMRAMEKLLARIHPKGRLSRRIEKYHRMLSLIMTYLFVLLVIFLVFYMLIPQVVNAVPPVIQSIEDAYPRLIALLKSYNIDASTLEAFAQSLDLEMVLGTVTTSLGTIVQTSLSAVSSVFSGLVLALTSIAFSVYSLANKRKLMCQAQRFLYAFVSKRYADKFMEVASLANKTFTNFLAGQCVEAVILGTLFFIVLTLFRIPFALVISVLIAVTALIPYVGAFIGCIFGGLLILTVSPAKALIFVIIFLVVQQLENQLIYPRVVGTSVGLSPMWILIAVYVGGKLFGVTGMMFFIPLTSVFYSVMRLHVQHRLKRRNLEVDERGVRSLCPDPMGEEDPSSDDEEVADGSSFPVPGEASQR